MKIINIAACAPYNEGWSYQENLLPKYQQKLGNEVILITTTKMHSPNGLINVDENDSITIDGFRVIRKKIQRSRIPILNKIATKINVYDILLKEEPDLIFYHGLVDTTIFQVKKYVKHKNGNCVVVQDNHLDSNIGFKKKSIVSFLFKVFYRVVYILNANIISKVYGVTPWRAEYAHTFFGVPHKKIDVLLMGADDDSINFDDKKKIRNELRQKYGLNEKDFVIITGGKLDQNKKVIELMEAVNAIKGKVHLIIFGEILADIREKFNELLNEHVNYIGWIDAHNTYDYFFMSDLIVFPGQHSVLWEQACASKVPCLFKYWPGMDHINNGGNSDFIYNQGSEAIKNKIIDLLFTKKYFEMKKVAESSNTDIYLYSQIAKKSIECATKN